MSTREYERLVASCFQLELDTEIGLSRETREWFDQQPVIEVTATESPFGPRRYRCYGCGEVYIDDWPGTPWSSPKLCRECVSKIDRLAQAGLAGD